MVQLQKACLLVSDFLMIPGAFMRCSIIPIVNGKSILNSPPKKFMESRVQPTPMLPYPEMFVAAKIENNIPMTVVVIISHLVDNLLIISAYRMLPIYSKNRDQLGPLRGNISPFPLMS